VQSKVLALISTAYSTRAIDLFTAFQPDDLILLDLMMPELDGYAVMEILSLYIAKDDYLPVIVSTSDATQTNEKPLHLA